jgi:hypothetical protein
MKLCDLADRKSCQGFGGSDVSMVSVECRGSHGNDCTEPCNLVDMLACIFKGFIVTYVLHFQSIRIIHSEDGGSMFLQNFATYLPNYTASHLGEQLCPQRDVTSHFRTKATRMYTLVLQPSHVAEHLSLLQEAVRRCRQWVLPKITEGVLVGLFLRFRLHATVAC